MNIPGNFPSIFPSNFLGIFSGILMGICPQLLPVLLYDARTKRANVARTLKPQKLGPESRRPP